MSPLSEPAQAELLRLARLCLEDLILRREEQLHRTELAELREARGTFVTLHSEGKLRGCIGVPMAAGPLFELVQKCAVSAATSDPRFPPVTKEELGGLSIEISVLSNLELVSGPEDFEIGVHGLLVSLEGRRGLLLPQVAVEHEWDKPTFLAQVCRKAGLPLSAWKRGARIERFSAQVFRERSS